MAAWIGLVPREYSTGGKTTLLGISKRGSSYLRRLLIHGARSCLLHLDRSRDRLGSWIDGLQSRMHNNKATVTLAAKMARVAWVVITKPGATYERRGRWQPDPRLRPAARHGIVMTRTVDRRTVNSVQKAGFQPEPVIRERGRADLIMAWLQKQPTRERPDTFMQTGSSDEPEPCNDGADHTFFQAPRATSRRRASTPRATS